MNKKILYNSFKHHSELIRELIISDIKGVSLPFSEIKNTNSIKKIPFILKTYSCYCKECGEYNEGKKIIICHNCENKLRRNFTEKFTINIYHSLKNYIANYNDKKIKWIFEDCSLEDIKNKNLKDINSKVIIHISPFFNFIGKFEIHKHNLNHIFLNWKDTFRLFSVKSVKKLINDVLDYVLEEKDSIILWNKISYLDFQNLTIDLLKKDNFSDPYFKKGDPRSPGGIGSDLGQDIICKKRVYKFLVQCKRNTGKNSVKPKDLRPDSHAVFHNCNAYLLVTSTYPTGKLAKELNDYNISKKIIKKAGWWNNKILREKLVEYDDIRRKYFKN